MKGKAETNITAVLRAAVLAVAILGQIALLVALTIWLEEFGGAVTYGAVIASAIAVMRLVQKNDDPTYRMAWLLIVIVMPIFGLLLYLLWGRATIGPRTRKHITRAFRKVAREMPAQQETLEEIAQDHPSRRRVCNYMARAGFPLYRNTRLRYYPLGEHFFDALCGDIGKAEHFIFLEYFIVDYGEVWDKVHALLREKAAQGVEVRLLYDDAGCLFTLKRGFAAELRAEGIKVEAFGNVHRYVSELHVNYRNHRKLAVIDGNIGYAGGNNIADEYANVYAKHGHWKDTAVRLEGEAVWSLTATFLGMWELAHSGAVDDRYADYRPTKAVSGSSYVQPVNDGPANNPENPIEDMYRQVISSAQQYCYITTPYLILDSSMTDALRIAARAGVDVRIYTPGIPDRWYVHPVTRSYYGRLLEEGVRIFEYTPGFIHAKMMVSDDDTAVVGSVNMDFRSFFLHYENTVLTVGDPIAVEIRKDIAAMEEQCREVLFQEWKNRPLAERAAGFCLRAFSTLM